MNSQLPEQADNPEGILLAGTVAGVDACSLVSNAGTIVVGSALDCDLTVTDPLVPARAFRLCRAAGGQGWLIEAFRNARVYVSTTAQAYPRVTAWNTSVGLARETVSVLAADLERGMTERRAA